jgi:ATP-dependent DNA ligase
VPTKKKSAPALVRIAFIESMECLPVTTLPEGKGWSFEIKLDGFRLEAVKKKGGTTLFSRRGNILNRKFPYVATALKGLPDDTILDGEVVALDSQGRSDFNLLQNFRSAESKTYYYVFDTLTLKGKDVSTRPLAERRKILAKTLKPNDHISSSPAEEGTSTQILAFVKEHGREATGQSLRAGQTLRRVVQVPHQFGPEIRRGWLHAGPKRIRRADLGILSG